MTMQTAPRGKFITLEGGEGVGKSTQIKRLIDDLARRGIKAIATREPGGSATAEEIRTFWFSKNAEEWDTLTALFIVMSARREHLVKTIWPALEQGTWVISDRYVDSSRAYQGICGELGIPKVDSVYKEIAGDFWPDLTLLLDLPVEIGLGRRKERNGPQDRFERQKLDFHEKLRKAYLDMAALDTKRFRVIDASRDIDGVAHDVTSTVATFFNLAVSVT